MTRSQKTAQWFWHDQRGGVAVIAGISFMPMLMAVGIGIELTHWTVTKAELQRTADLAALAGAKEYLIAANAQRSVNAAANVAELNGAAGSTSRTWDPTSQLLSDNQVTAQITDGVSQKQSIAVKVIVRQAMPLVLTSVMSSAASVTIAATGWADASSYVKPCVFAMDSGGAGIDAQGSVSVKLTGCSMRSNAAITTGGNAAVLSADAFYARTSITSSATGGPRFPNAGTATNPYADYDLVKNALAKVSTTNGSPVNVQPSETKFLTSSSSLNSWSKWDIKGTVKLGPGIYYVKGDISLGSGAILSGSGVTIVTSGTVSMGGSSTVELSAAREGAAVNGAIPGVVFIGGSASRSTLGGNAKTELTGVVYYPNGALDFGGTSQGGSTGCLEVVAKSITMTGNPSLASNCTGYGTLPLGNDATTSALVR